MTNRRTIWMLALLLCAVMALGLFTSVALADDEITTWAELQAALNHGGTIVVTQSITAGPGDGPLVVPEGVTVDLAVTGFNRLDRGLGGQDPVADGYVIRNEGTLTFKGEIIGGNNSGNGGGIYNTGTLTLNGDVHYNYSALDGGGVYNAGTLNLVYHMAIESNTAGRNGGGVYNAGTLTLNGGQDDSNYIRYNTAGQHGGGVYNSGTLNLNGGEIQYNSAASQGGAILNNGTLNVSGRPEVSSNTAASGNDVYLRADHPTINVGSWLRSTIGVRGARRGTFTSGLMGETGNFFYCDDDNYTIDEDENGEACFVPTLENCRYISRAWEDGQLTKTSAEVDGEWQVWPTDGSTSIPAGKYVLLQNVTVNNRVMLQGDTSIVLCDGYTLDVRGLYIPAGHTLTIYGQALETGRLYSHPSGGAGIGGYSGHDNGNIVIHSGTVEANGYNNCAGIGGNSNQSSDDITIYGGTVTATGGSNGAGIGGGQNRDGYVTIYGGTVTATGGSSGAGIGGGMGNRFNDDGNGHGGGNVSIYGGTVTATGGSKGAGIGAGCDTDGGIINIYGGNVTATAGGESAAGIGGADASGDYEDFTSIYIYGGTVTAAGDNKGAGIGGGEYGTASITISGGSVTATGGDEGGAGIGSGADGARSIVYIYGGTVSATSAASNGYGIGDGKNKKGTSEIYLDYTEATAGSVSITASSYSGEVTLLNPFAMHSYSRLFPAGRVTDPSLLGGGALTWWNGTVFDWHSLQMAISGANDGGVITLGQDMYASRSSDSALAVPAGKNITIDLNGHTLDRGLANYDARSEGYVLLNEGALTLMNGTVTGGNTQGDVGGIDNAGTLTLTNVTVTANTATGSGGGIRNNGTLTVNSGAITNNHSVNWHGGGIANNGTLTLNGGAITGNSAGQQGGGILQNGTMNISGAPVVKNNTAATGNNIYLRSGHPTMAVTGRLTSGAEIRVTSAGGAAPITTGYGAKNGSEYPGAYFRADDDQYVISLKDGEANIASPFTVTVNADAAGRLSVDKSSAAQGDTVTFTVLDDTAMNMISVFYMQNGSAKHVAFTAGADNTGTFVMPGGDVTVRINPPVRYVENGETKTYSGNYTVVTSDTTTWTDGWYVVNANVTIDQRIEVQGNVKLVLMGTSQDDDCFLVANGGVHVPYGNILIVYGETNIWGSLSASNAQNTDQAAIGGNSGEQNGNIVVYSGQIGADSRGNGACIGGGKNAMGYAITIHGGSVMAATGGRGAGIGGGYQGNGQNITINGGIVYSVSYEGAGIGGGNDGIGQDITINGGTVTAIGSRGAGIGGGYRELGHLITITGGDVSAISHTGAGIGFGAGYSDQAFGAIEGVDAVIINGGRVEASSTLGYALVSGDSKVNMTAHVYIDAFLKVLTGSSKDNLSLQKPNDPPAWPTIRYTIIEPCEHEHATWEITATGHKMICNECRKTLYNQFPEEPHTLGVDGVCTVCGYDSNSFYVFFDSDGGAEVQAQLVPNGQKATQPAAPEKDGFTFHGWHLVTNGVMATETFDFNTPITASITLKASWTHEHDGITFLPWDSANSLPTAAGSYYLKQDVTLTDVEGWTWQSGTLNLCLNGHTVTGNGTYQGLIRVNGGAVHVYDEDEGVITQSNGRDATVCVGAGGAFTLHGGTVSNTTEGLYAVDARGSFTMTGGAVTGSWHGVLVNTGAVFTVSGDARVADNTENNVFLQDNADRIHIGGPLSSTARFGVDMINYTGVFTQGLGEYGTAGNFFVDGGSSIVTVRDGEAYIETLFTVTVNPGEGSGTAFTVSSDNENNWGEYTAYGKFVRGGGSPMFCAPAGSVFTAPAGKMFLGWKVDGDDTLYDEGCFIPAGTFAITAQWANVHTITWAGMPGGADWISPAAQAPAGEKVSLIVRVDGDAHSAGLRLTGFTVTGDGMNTITVDTDPTGNPLEPMEMGMALYTTLFTMPDADVTVTAVWQYPAFGAPDFVLPALLTTVEEEAFAGIAATVVDVPANCTAIGDHAFRNCPNLTQIRIPAGCVLGTDVFDGCTKVYVFGTAGSSAESYCNSHSNCVFVKEGQD